MTDSIEKLIAGGEWRPIEEAPRDGVPFLFNWPDAGKTMFVAKYAHKKLWYFSYKEGEWTVFTRDTKGCTFRPLPDDRLALVCRELLDYVRGRAWQNLEPTSQRGALEILARCEKIAEGKDG